MNQAERQSLEDLARRWENYIGVGNDLGKVAAIAKHDCAKELREFLKNLPKEKPSSPFCQGCNNPNCKDRLTMTNRPGAALNLIFGGRNGIVDH